MQFFYRMFVCLFGEGTQARSDVAEASGMVVALGRFPRLKSVPVVCLSGLP